MKASFETEHYLTCGKYSTWRKGKETDWISKLLHYYPLFIFFKMLNDSIDAQ